MTTVEERQTTGQYMPSEVESKWQERWDQSGIYKVRDDDPRPKWYELTMYPYPSGDLHIGHWYAMSGADAHARFRRMQGFNVLHPMGFDAFGLNAENAAIERGVHPREWTYANIDAMRGQRRSCGRDAVRDIDLIRGKGRGGDQGQGGDEGGQNQRLHWYFLSCSGLGQPGSQPLKHR